MLVTAGRKISDFGFWAEKIKFIYIGSKPIIDYQLDDININLISPIVIVCPDLFLLVPRPFKGFQNWVI